MDHNFIVECMRIVERIDPSRYDEVVRAINVIARRAEMQLVKNGRARQYPDPRA